MLDSKTEDKLLFFFNELLQMGQQMVGYGVSEVLLNNLSWGSHKQHNAVNDFVYFCFTKSTKTFSAIEKLILYKHHEDALILIRSIYENYLMTRFVLDNPEQINNFVYYPIGKSIMRYKIEKKDKVLILKEPSTGKILDDYIEFGYKEIGLKYEPKIHNQLYKFLSEFTHPNMISLGSYMQKGLFTYDNENNKHNALILSIFCYLKIIQEIRTFEEYDDDSLTIELPKLILKIKKTIVQLFNNYCQEISNTLNQRDPITYDKKRSLINTRKFYKNLISSIQEEYDL